MNKEDLRSLLHQEFKAENWKIITEFVFPNVSYLQRPQAIPFNNDKVESFKQVGNVKLNDGKNLAMFEVKVAKNVNLARNRVELRKLVENLIDKERNHGVLVVYEQGKEDYRFTFTAKSTEFDEQEGDFVNSETDAKRFTYILGKNESCKTAANRFWELSNNKDKATIKDVENAFSVERLNKEFFDKYKNFYEDFVEYITGKRFVKEKGKWTEKITGRANQVHKEVFGSDDKKARNFVKLLLGRLVFIQFLQKKGWMGVPSISKKWENGEKEFLFNFFNAKEFKDQFHSKNLFILFDKAFNKPKRPNDIFELTGTRVPYLNGGLFENDYHNADKVDFPDTYFEGLLDFFGQYNFTIDENDPMDHEVGIDPEMLGHIFENLLEDNKDKGAFYTPKPIVQYMCQESLIQYLKTYLQEHQLWPKNEAESKLTETNLQNFVRKKIAGELLNDYDEHLARALKEVKICDPAIGSGAFPMGLLNEIFHCMQVLHDASPDTIGSVWEMESWAPNLVKKNIIQHSIYGVDIEKGAVDIARLRFWLSLIIEEIEPSPLPNLNYKIVVGDSLSEIKLDLFSESTLREIEKLKDEFFLLSAPNEKKIHQDNINTFINSLKKSNNDFDFKVYFSEVFNEKKGFDIVIGNPPFGAQLDHNELIKRFGLSKKRLSNSYSYFIELGLKLRNRLGNLALIVPNTWLSISSSKELRKTLFVDNTTSDILLTHQVFESMSDIPPVVDTVIFISSNSIPKKSIIKVKMLSAEKSIKGRLIEIQNRTWNSIIMVEISPLNEYKILLSGELIVPKVLTFKLEAKKQINKFIVRIGAQEYAVNKGVPPLNKVQVESRIYHSDKKIDKTYKLFVPSGDIQRYQFSWSKKYLKWGENLHCPREKIIYVNEHILVSRIYDKKNNRLKACFIEQGKGEDFYVNNTDSFNILAIENSDYYLKFILAILNSKLTGYFLSQENVNLLRKVYPKVNTNDVKNIQIPIVNKITQNKMCLLVEQIQNADDPELVEKYDCEIEVNVFKLYGLGYKEFKIILPTSNMLERKFNEL